MNRSFENNPFETYQADIYYHLGISYSNIELFNESIDPLSKAIDLCKNEACYIHERAKSYLQVDMPQKALQDYDRVI